MESAFLDTMVETSAAIGELLRSPQEALGLRRFFEELSNLRTAVARSFATDPGPDRVFDLALPVAPGGFATPYSVEPID
jgi:hypothetical protein